MNEIMRKRPAEILSMQPLGTVGIVGIERPIEREEAPRDWRPDLWPWWIWVPLSIAPVVLAWLILCAIV